MAKLQESQAASVVPPATLPSPAAFPLGSTQSRAAARALLERRSHFQPTLWLIMGHASFRQPSIVRCAPGEDGSAVVIVSLPPRGLGWTKACWREFLDRQPPDKLRLWGQFFARWSHPPDRGGKDA